MAKRLTDKHPLKDKFNKLEEFMNNLNIQLDWDGYHMNFIDTKTGESAKVRDADEGTEVCTIPHLIECKLVID